ncbi:MAG: glycosyltransferase family 4 protein [Aulosira sp. ZfuVER01]|nr:glycosyltransferase [Aulosira sp. ZfuVER01]MDZ7998059.1 glycosyltransferase [Aulosira sp. DedVER01a]MDZ8050453.1 glycosyltransferase [Aulosira sp. ZfuCHP01]
MKIVYVTTNLSTGGAQMMLYRLLSRIDRNRFSVAVISLMDCGTVGELVAALNIPIYTLNIKAGMLATPAVVLRLISTINTLKPDLIQGWMYHGNLAAQIASIFYSKKIPVFWNIQHSVYSLAYEKSMTANVIKLGAALSKFSSKIIYVSRIGRSQHEGLGYCVDKGYVIPNAADTSLFMPSVEARLAVRQELGLTDNAFLIGLICRYHPMKDHANFLQAAAILLKDYPDVHFVLVGTDVEQTNQELSELIQKLGIANRIHLLGERKDIAQLTAALDIAASASAYGEAFPLIVAEAMAAGVPCTVTDVGDSGWVIDKTGRVVPPKNPQALADAWKELITLGVEGRAILGKAARERAIEYCALDSITAKYEALYETA